MKKPIILLYTNVYDTTVGQGKAYMNFFSQFGDVLLVTSEMNLTRMIELGDILALPGGQDLNPDRYNARPGFNMKEVNTHYEYLDKYLLTPWIETGKPIVGICRGMQALNVVCGGSLHRHVNGHVQGDDYWRHDTPHKMFTYLVNEKKDYVFPIVDINSYHHQAVCRVAPGFSVIGWSDYADRDPAKKKAQFSAARFYHVQNSRDKRKSKEDHPMIPEMMVHDDRPYIAFQYHPEEFNCGLAVSLIKEVLTKYYATQEKTFNFEEEEAAPAGHA